MSELRPGWLSDDERWREQLGALTTEDREWLEEAWGATGGGPPQVDVSWVKIETIGDSVWVPVLIAVVLIVMVWAPLMLWIA